MVDALLSVHLESRYCNFMKISGGFAPLDPFLTSSAAHAVHHISCLKCEPASLCSAKHRNFLHLLPRKFRVWELKEPLHNVLRHTMPVGLEIKLLICFQ